MNTDKTKIILLLFLIFGMMLLLFMPPHMQEEYKIWSFILFVIGVGILFLTVKKLYNVQKASSWEKTEAKILHTEIKVDNPTAREFVWSYYPYIRYQYHVNKREYVSDRVAFYRELRDNKLDVKQYIDTLINPKLHVYYNPKNPHESTIIKTLPFSRKIFWYFFLLLGMGSVYIVLA